MPTELGVRYRSSGRSKWKSRLIRKKPFAFGTVVFLKMYSMSLELKA